MREVQGGGFRQLKNRRGEKIKDYKKLVKMSQHTKIPKHFPPK